MIGDVFRTVTRAATNVVSGFVENVRDVAADLRPETIARFIAPEATAAITAASTISSVAARSRQREGVAYAPPQQPVSRSSTMPHMEGHRDGELPVAGVGLENVSQAFIGAGTQALSNIARGLIRGLPRGTGSAAGGVAGGIAGGLLMDGRMGKCAPKPFVRFTDCGDPIITRKMKKQAIEAVNCSGAQAAANALTDGDLDLLTEIISKQFPPRRMGISGAQMATTERTQRKLMRFHKRMLEACKTPTRRR